MFWACQTLGEAVADEKWNLACWSSFRSSNEAGKMPWGQKILSLQKTCQQLMDLIHQAVAVLSVMKTGVFSVSITQPLSFTVNHNCCGSSFSAVVTETGKWQEMYFRCFRVIWIPEMQSQALLWTKFKKTLVLLIGDYTEWIFLLITKWSLTLWSKQYTSAALDWLVLFNQLALRMLIVSSDPTKVLRALFLVGSV